MYSFLNNCLFACCLDHVKKKKKKSIFGFLFFIGDHVINGCVVLMEVPM